MNIDSIGTWAGQVYQALEAANDKVLEFKQLRKVTKLKKDELLTAIGWLGREGKIVITEQESDLLVALV